MKKLWTLLFFAFLFSLSPAQTPAFKFGTLTPDLGVGFGMYGIRSYSPVNNETHSAIGFVGSLPTFSAEFGLLRFLGVGVMYRRGTYGRSGSETIRGNDYMVMASFHLLNKKEKFDLPIGVGYGFSSMKAKLTPPKGLQASGSIIMVHVSPHFYFGKYIGMFLRVGYRQHLFGKMHVKDENGVSYNESQGAYWRMGGPFFEFGISGRFQLLNKDSD